jgi:hypothetical protein
MMDATTIAMKTTATTTTATITSKTADIQQN